ncbi:MAG: hypothetical protein V1670_03205 [Candidatus Omnitrophota bacterium]
MRKKSGQSILEYVIVLIAIVAAVSVGAYVFAKKGDTSKGLGKLMNDSAEVLTRSTSKIGNITNQTN